MGRWLAALGGALVLAGGAPPPATAAAREALTNRSEIVRRSIEHHGGEIYRHSEASLELCSKSGCYQMTVRTAGGLYSHEVSGPYRGRTRTVRSDNDSVAAWRDGEPLVTLSSGRQGLRDWAMQRIYFVFLPFRLEDPSVLHEELGTEAWSGRPLRKVKVTFIAGSSTDAEDEYLYWFDPETARLEQFAYSFQGRPGGLRFRRLSNYRRVGGILFFDQENLGIEGPELTVDQITPDFVGQRMRQVSQIELRGIKVQPLTAE